MIGGHYFGEPYFAGAPEYAAGGIKTGSATITGVSTWTAAGTRLTGASAGGGDRRRRGRKPTRINFYQPPLGEIKTATATLHARSFWRATGSRVRSRRATLTCSSQLTARGDRLPGAPLEEFLILMGE